MRLIRKLAAEYALIRNDPEESKGLKEATLGYEAGFRAARDMMIVQIVEAIGTAGLETIGCDPKMGEDEA